MWRISAELLAEYIVMKTQFVRSRTHHKCDDALTLTSCLLSKLDRALFIHILQSVKRMEVNIINYSAAQDVSVLFSCDLALDPLFWSLKETSKLANM